MLTPVSYSVKEIKRRKLRSSANILGYTLAVAFLIIIVTLSQGYNIVAATSLSGIGTHFATYVPASQDCPCQFGEVGPYFKNTYTPTFNASIVDTVKSLPGVADAAPCMVFRLNNVTISGIDPDSLATSTVAVAQDEVTKGRFLESNDSNSIMLDYVFSQLSNLDVGDTIAVFEHNLTVVGIVNPGLHSKPAGIANMYANINTVQEIAKYYGNLYGFTVRDINVILVEVSSQGGSNYITSVETSVQNTLEDYAGKPGAIVGYQCSSAARNVISVTESSAWTVSVILFTSVIFFSLRSQFGSVIERTREIAILKAIGWTNGDVTNQVCFESLFQGLIGGIAGATVGYLIICLIPKIGLVQTQNLVLTVSPFLIIIGLAASLLGGILAGLIPAWRAARLQPAEALRHF